ARYDAQARGAPELAGGFGETWIDLDAAGVGDRPGREGLAQGRVERAAADGRVEEGGGIAPALPALERVPGDVQGELRRRGELAEAVALGGGPGRVEASLDGLPPCLRVEHAHIPSKSGSLNRCSFPSRIG